MQLAEACLRQATAESSLRELRKEVNVERAAAALKKKIQKDESSENERKLATEVGKLRMELQHLHQDTDASAQQTKQLQSEVRDARFKISSLTRQVEEHQEGEREAARQAVDAMRAGAAIQASLKATSEALERLKTGLYAAKHGEQQALDKLRAAEKRFALAGAEAEARLALVEKAEAGAASLRSKLASAERALHTVEEQAEAAEEHAAEAAEAAAQRIATQDTEIYLLKKKIDLADAGKEQTVASMSALKQAIETERAEKVAAQGALQTAQREAEAQINSLSQELQELRDVLALQEGAAGGAGEAAALAEAEAAQLRATNGSLQRELRESKQALSDQQSRLAIVERLRDTEQASRVQAETTGAELAARLSEVEVRAHRRQKEHQDATSAWTVERSRLEALAASEARQKESVERELAELQERLTKMEKAHLQERHERRAAARAVESGAENARREHVSEQASLRLKAEEAALEQQMTQLTVKRLQELEHELRYELEVRMHLQ